MRGAAQFLDRPGQPLRAGTLDLPAPGPGQVALSVRACAVCRTDLHVFDGELPDAKLPLVLGHEIVAAVTARGPGVERFAVGDRVGVGWLAWACGQCRDCRAGRENLCPFARFTGYHVDGGYAECALAQADFCFALPAGYADAVAAPLLCAGLIGHRTLRAAGDAERVGIYGFGSAAHLVTQVARHEGRQVFAFTRPGDAAAQAFARASGAVWAGGSDTAPPEELDAALIFAPVGDLVPVALRAVRRGGTVVCGGIHMSDVPRFPYALLWGERSVRSVANLTRRDGEEFLAIAARVPLHIEVETHPLSEASAVLERLRRGLVRGVPVLEPPR
jgi:propanol-preferring alcohol dehydrogenase